MAFQQQQKVAIIGAGAAGLMAADRLSFLRSDLSITLYDAMPSPARKILMAGKSGLNISHQDGINRPDQFLHQYGAAAPFMAPLLQSFSTPELLQWMAALGQECFTGSSGRLFPNCMKASPLLRQLLQRLEKRGVTLQRRHRWVGWDEQDRLVFETPSGASVEEANATLLALGGPSWPRLGTDGAFFHLLTERGIPCAPYKPANCGFDVDWPLAFVEKWAGHPLKSVVLHFEETRVPGDFMIAQYGIEGGPVYRLSAALRDTIDRNGHATLFVDLRPHLTTEALAAKLSRPRGKQSLSNHLRKTIHLKGIQAALVKAATSRATMQSPNELATALKALPLLMRSPRPIEEAISTAGGVSLDALDAYMMLKAKPGLFVAGEMLDWEAPTGGYLLTACLSQGWCAAEGVAAYLS